MEETKSFDEILALANEKIILGENLIEKLNSFKKNQTTGLQKIQRKINQEIKFLKKAISTKTLKLNHVTCSNLIHYNFLVQVFLRQTDVICVDEKITFEDQNTLEQRQIKVDIICESGSKWIKVIARNSKSISDIAKGACSYGARSIVDQAKDFITSAEQNLHLFKCPKVQFYFSSRSIEPELLNAIRLIGIEPKSLNDENVIEENETNHYQLLNLDITTLIAYVSNLSNGSCKWIFKETLLTEQAERESMFPVKTVLDEIFKDKKLICCHTALSSFQEIIELLAGPKEKQRAHHLLGKLEVMDDIDISSLPSEFQTLTLCGRIKPRSLKIFAFGYKMKAITVTSNEGFIRSARMQGVNIPVFLHQARALTELKEEMGVASES